MSSPDFPVVAALEAIAACERLSAQLPHFADSLEHAAAVARRDWEGPHRESFDHRVAAADRVLRHAAGTLGVLRVRVADEQHRPR